MGKKIRKARFSARSTASGTPTRNRVARGITITIPGRKKPLQIERVVFDFNGTMAVDGKLIRGMGIRLKRLAALVDVVVMTADTFGTVRRTIMGLPATVRIVNNGAEKRRFVESIGAETVAAIGNGTNDIPMLGAVSLGIAVFGTEGTSAELLRVSTIVVRHINDAIDLLLKPKRLVATLRR
jgi:soluble P-type ATPase